MSAALPRLASFVLRRDRTRVLAWSIGLSLLVLVTASAWERLYPTLESREQFASALATTPAVTAVLGPINDATTVGGLTSWRLSSILMLVLSIVGVFLIVRHTRTDVAEGRADLLLSGRLNRRSMPLAALVSPLVLLLLFSALSFLILLSFAQSPMGALAFVASVSGGALVFIALTLIAVGVFATSRGASGATTAVVAAFFLVFVASSADSGLSWLSVLTPFGWASRAGAFAGEEWWWVAVPFILTLAIAITAIVRAGSRDVGAAILSAREGRAEGGAWLGSPLALAWRVDQSLVYLWLGVLTFLAIVVGVLTKSASALLESNPQLQQMVERVGETDNFTDAYAASLIGLLSLGTTAFAITLLLRNRVDEEVGRTELVLSADVSRQRLLSARIVIAGVSSLVIQAVIGLTLGIAYTLAAGAGWSPIGRYLGVALLSTAAIWLMASITVLVTAALPRRSWLPWAAFAYIVAMGEFGPLLNLPVWLQATTPFWFIPRWPMEPFNAVPLIVLVAISVALCSAAYPGLRRRGIPG